MVLARDGFRRGPTPTRDKRSLVLEAAADLFISSQLSGHFSHVYKRPPSHLAKARA